MPIIENKKVYDHSKSELPLLNKELDKAEKTVVKLSKSSKELAKALELVKKSNDGTEAKKLADGTNKLTKSTKKLKDALTAEEKVKQDILKANTRLAQSRTKAAKDLALVRQKTLETNKALREQAKATLGVKNRTNGLISGLKNLGKQLVGALGIAAGIGIVVAQFNKMSQRSKELNKLTRELVGTFDITTREAKKLAAQINAMAVNIEGVDARKLQISLNAIVKTFGDISEQEALDLIQEGFAKGSNNSDEFLDILKEYPGFFQKAGLSASEMFAIINQQVKEGVYSDKGVDAIKEATIQLTENTKIVRDALKPLGESVNLQIRQKVEAGKAFEAMQLITREMVSLGTNSAETQTIIADVFKGAGEDSEAFVKNLHNVNLSLDDVAKQTSVNSEANIELSKAYNALILSVSDGEGIWSQSIASIKSWGAEVLNSLRIFGEADFTTRLKQIANGLLTVTGAGSKFQFQIDETTDALKLQNKEQTTSIRLTKEQKDALAQETTEKEKQSALNKEEEKARKKRIKDLEKLNREKEKQLKIDQKIREKREEDLVAEIEGGELRSQTKTEEKEQFISDQEEITASFVANQEAQAQAAVEANEKFLRQAAVISSVAQTAGEELGALMAEGQLTFKEFGKLLLKTTIDLVQKQVSVLLVAILAREIASKSFAGIATAAVLEGLIIAALQVAKAKIASFEDGGPVGGERHSKGGTIIEAEKGEFVVNRGGYSKAPDIINAVNDGILTDRNAGKLLSKEGESMLLLSAMMKGNDTSRQLLQAMLNMGWIEPGNGTYTRHKADGSSSKTLPLK